MSKQTRDLLTPGAKRPATWHPIALAPKDDTPLVVLGGGAGSEPVIASCGPDEVWQVLWNGDVLAQPPARWRYLDWPQP